MCWRNLICSQILLSTVFVFLFFCPQILLSTVFFFMTINVRCVDVRFFVDRAHRRPASYTALGLCTYIRRTYAYRCTWRVCFCFVLSFFYAEGLLRERSQTSSYDKEGGGGQRFRDEIFFVIYCDDEILRWSAEYVIKIVCQRSDVWRKFVPTITLWPIILVILVFPKPIFRLRRTNLLIF